MLVIDLLSCLDEGQGIGKSLVKAVVAECSRLGLKAVEVTTECENTAAWHLYMKCGFQTDVFFGCYHLVEPADALTNRLSPRITSSVSREP